MTVALLAPRVAHDYEFTRADFERVRRLIHAHAGISLADSKYEMVYSRLAKRLKAVGAPGFRPYLDRLEAGPDAEWQHFANALTTNLTSFFRESHHFPVLAQYLREHAGRAPLRIWCSAASTGEEPYSIAITAAEAFGNPTPPVSILATDIDTDVLARGQRGVYELDRIGALGEERLRRFFLKGRNAHAGSACVKPELAALIEFRQLNLLASDWPGLKPFDVIFCRNVMIYFDRPTQLKVLRRFHPLLREDGLLFAGHSEHFFHAQELFQPCGRTVYRKVST